MYGDKVDLLFLGGLSNTANSVFLVDRSTERNILFDFGSVKDIKPNLDLLEFRYGISSIKNMFVSHAHYDHFGGIPLLALKGYKGNVFTSYVTADLLSKLNFNFLYNDIYKSSIDWNDYIQAINNFFKRIETVDYFVSQPLGSSFYLTLLPTQHIPGSSMACVEILNKKILYTGDMSGNTKDMISSVDNIDLMIFDASLLHHNDDNFDYIIHQLIQLLEFLIDNKIAVLFPVRPLGNGFIILDILNEFINIDIPEIVVDGRFAQNIKMLEYLNYDHLKIKYFRNDKENPIIISTGSPDKKNSASYRWKKKFDRLVVIYTEIGQYSAKRIENIYDYSEVDSAYAPLTQHASRDELFQIAKEVRAELAIPLFHNNIKSNLKNKILQIWNENVPETKLTYVRKNSTYTI